LSFHIGGSGSRDSGESSSLPSTASGETEVVVPHPGSADLYETDELPPLQFQPNLVADPVAPRYYAWETTYPELQILIDNIAVIMREVASISSDTFVPWPEGHVYGSRDTWTVFPFLHTFPAFDADKMTWIDRTCAMCPETTRLLRGIPNIRTALFSRIAPSSRLSPHTGWADLANHVLRCHLGLRVPVGSEGEPVCGMEVEDEVAFHEQGGFVVFDDSKRHLAFNNSDSEDRVVLIVDMLRPADVPLGRAVGGHTAQLDDFISSFK